MLTIFLSCDIVTLSKAIGLLRKQGDTEMTTNKFYEYVTTDGEEVTVETTMDGFEENHPARQRKYDKNGKFLSCHNKYPGDINKYIGDLKELIKTYTQEEAQLIKSHRGKQ